MAWRNRGKVYDKKLFMDYLRVEAEDGPEALDVILRDLDNVAAILEDTEARNQHVPDHPFLTEAQMYVAAIYMDGHFREIVSEPTMQKAKKAALDRCDGDRLFFCLMQACDVETKMTIGELVRGDDIRRRMDAIAEMRDETVRMRESILESDGPSA